eukprot:TRINITY_DN55474_c0_g1_i1.p1 TRINITY_DN55474_c0_g1~~TRINITY_DN55474_c0_g1_i1.p1  ORF type:complete len:687 (-),score=83.52 TRINITY_DN55474_c0_g1_i1:231-2117(-)
MVDSLSGKDWVAKWEAKVVMATVTKAETLGVVRAKVICISGGRHCDLEMARQPALVRAIKQEMNMQDFRVRVEWMDYADFVESYGGVGAEKHSEGKGNGKGKCKEGKNAGSRKSKHGKEGEGAEKRREDKGEGRQGKGEDNRGKNESIHSKGGNKLGKVASTPSHDKGQPNKSHIHEDNVTKMKVCKFFLQGICQKGSSCTFLHSLVESDGARGDGIKSKSKGKGYKPQGAGQGLSCNACGRAFATEHALQQHWESKPECNMAAHGGMISIGPCLERCRVCDREFESEAALSQHLLSSGHGESFGGPQGDQAFAKQLDQKFADSLRRGLDNCRIDTSLSPDVRISVYQRSLDDACATLFEWACFLRKRGADFDLNAGHVVQGCDGCDAGFKEYRETEFGTKCKKCGGMRKLLRFCAPTNVPPKTKESASRLDKRFCETIARYGFSPTTDFNGGPMAAVACGAMAAFLSDYGGSDEPRLLKAVPSRVPNQGCLRELDNLAFVLMRSWTAGSGTSRAPKPPPPVHVLMQHSVSELKKLIADAGLDVAKEQAAIESLGINEKAELASYVHKRLAAASAARQSSSTGSPIDAHQQHVVCSLCTRKFPDSAHLERHKSNDHGRLLKYVSLDRI